MQSANDQFKVINRLAIHYAAKARPGEFKFGAMSADFDGWLLCDGREISIEAYPELYLAVGNSFGEAQEGSFRIPDPRGRVLGIASESWPLGSITGSETHTLTIAEMPAHYHTGNTSTAAAHTHTGTTEVTGDHSHGAMTGTAGLHNHGGSTGPGGDAKESESADSGGGVVVSGEGSHTHAIASDGIHSHPISVDGAHSHSFTTNSSGAHDHSFVTTVSGNGIAHNIMQPTLFMGNMFIYGGQQVRVPYLVTS